MIPRQPCVLGYVLLPGVGYVLHAVGLACAPRPAPAVGSAATALHSRRDGSHCAAARGVVRLRFEEQLLRLPPICGNISQAIPLFSTKMMPISLARSSMRGLPPL